MLGSAANFSKRLLRWYDQARRHLPWRTTGEHPPDPYRVLVSEAMLQQTQVATVIPYFHRFIEQFPTWQALASADEQRVLRAWQGLGYYSRARNLQSAAKKVVNDLRGHLPRDVEGLLQLPGVGRYTAGAVASIAFGVRAPILDGNVLRVLCRIDKITTDPRDTPTQALLWHRAEAILPLKRIGDFNSSLMELGALICTPRSPQCLLCPVRGHCEAQAAGLQEQIPAPRKAKPTPLFRRHVYCISRKNEWLIEQRPSRGRWAGMWQFVTIDPGNDERKPAVPFGLTKIRRIGEVSHGLTHRRYIFEVFMAAASGKLRSPDERPRQWTTLEGLSAYPLPRPHVKIAEMLRASAGAKVASSNA